MEIEKKTEEQLRDEIAQEFNWSEDDNKEDIDRVLEIKKDRYQATQAKKKAQGELEGMTKGKEWYKSQAKEAKSGKKPNTDLNKETQISSHDKAYLYAQGYARTEVRYLEKVMRATGKEWEKAMNDNLFQTWQKGNDALITRRGSTLPASRGGMSEKRKTDHDKMVDKFSQDLPKGFSAKSQT